MRKLDNVAGLVLSLAVAGCVTKAIDPPMIEARSIAQQDGNAIDVTKIKAEIASLDLRPVGFTRVQTTVPRGSIIGIAKFRPLTCYYESRMHYDDDRKMLNTAAYNDIFYRVFSGYGYNVAGNPNALFASTQNEPDLEIGANLSKVYGEFCRHVDSWSGRPDGNYSGTMNLTVNWQLFDPVRRRVIWQKDVEGVFTAPGPLAGDYELFVQHAFADAANKLAADPSLRAVLAQKPMREASANTAPKVAAPTRLVPRQRQFSANIDAQIDQIRSAMVLIEAGTSHGSGFVIREDGLIVTNQHVVGSQRFVRVRLLSGRTVVGEVLNWDDRRDVALVKLEGTGYPVLPIRETPVRVTEEVFAIGAPRYESLGWSVTRGAISAYRQAEPPQSLDLIQSDVPTHGGNSGGPLVDRQGNVVAICVSGIDPNRKKSNASLNFFIPIMDGLQKLGVELVDPAAYERASKTAAAR